MLPKVGLNRGFSIHKKNMFGKNEGADADKKKFLSHFKDEHGEKFDDHKIITHIKRNFQKMVVIDKQSYLVYIFNALCCFFRRKSRA